MAGLCSAELEARKRRLDELFEDDPFLSATMRASRLHEREPVVPMMRKFRAAPIEVPVSMQPAKAAASAQVTRIGFVVDVRQEAGGMRAEIRQEASEVMSSAEAARFLRVSVSTLRRLSREEGLPYARIGRARLYRKPALLRWLKSREEMRQEA